MIKMHYIKFSNNANTLFFYKKKTSAFREGEQVAQKNQRKERTLPLIFSL